MGKLELILKKDNYLKSRNLVSCTPDELAAALGVSSRNIRKYLREDSRAFNAMQDAGNRWTIYRSAGYDGAVPDVKPVLADKSADAGQCKSETERSDYKVGFAPWVGENPRVLILGSLPGDISIRQQTYYANANNCFWKIMRALFRDDVNADNRTFITSKGIALWDSAHSGVRKGSLDSAIDGTSVVPNDIVSLLDEYPTIRTIIFNGKRAETIFEQYNKNVACDRIRLISTSPAATKSFDYKLDCWSVIKELVK